MFVSYNCCVKYISKITNVDPLVFIHLRLEPLDSNAFAVLLFLTMVQVWTAEKNPFALFFWKTTEKEIIFSTLFPRTAQKLFFCRIPEQTAEFFSAVHTCTIVVSIL